MQPGNFIAFDHGQTYADDFETFSQKAPRARGRPW